MKKLLIAGALALACLTAPVAASASCSGYTANTAGTTLNGLLEALTEICNNTLGGGGGGGGTQYAEDTASASGDTGTMMLAVRRDTAVGDTSANGDRGTLTVDQFNRLWVNGITSLDWSQQATCTATIANAASLSGACDLALQRLAGIQMPAAWTAASLSFQASYDGTNYFDLYDQAGNEITVTTSTSRRVALNMGDYAGIRYIKVRSGPTGTPVAQGASRDLILITEAR